MISKLLRVQSPPARTELSDNDLVIRARTALGLLDFDFFRTAWRDWHGAEPEDRAIEPEFVTYLFQQRIPGYVRHFARKVLSAAAAGRLDPVVLGVPHDAKREVQPSLDDGFAEICVLCALAFFVVIVL